MGAVTAAAPVRLHEVTLAIGAETIVRQLSGVFAPGSLTALVGPNGSGKTTLLRTLANLHKPSSGQIDRGGLKPRDIALLPQMTRIDRSFPITCRQLVAMGAASRYGSFRGIPARMMAEADAALAKVGLPDHGGRSISALSAGQLQRILFARLILQDAPLLLLDEPFNAIDQATCHDLMGLVRSWHDRGVTVVMALHDQALVREQFPDCLKLGPDGTNWGPTEAVLGADVPLVRRHAA